MKINTLSYNFFDQNDGSFELLVDGVPLAELVNYEDTLIPFWIIDNGIPTFPPHESPEEINERIVAVCGCGEYGCDSITCQIEIAKDFVIFSKFKRPGYSRIINETFIFTKENFQEIEKQITNEATKIRQNFENKD